MLACWPLELVVAALAPSAERDALDDDSLPSSGPSSVRPTTHARAAAAADADAGGRVLVLTHAEERVECGCAPGDAERALHCVNELQDSLLAVRKRRGRGRVAAGESPSP